MVLQKLELEAPLSVQSWRPYVLAIQKTMEYTLLDSYLNQSVVGNPEFVMQAMDIVLTAMNVSNEYIFLFLSNIFIPLDGPSTDAFIKDLIMKILDMKLLGDWPVLNGLLGQLLYVEDTSQILEKVTELINYYSTTEDNGVYLSMQILSKVYQVIAAVLPSASYQISRLSAYSDLFINLASNGLYLLRQIASTSSLFAPIDNYLSPLQMQLSLGQNLGNLVSQTRNYRSMASNVNREPVDDFLDLIDIDYNTLAQVLSVPLTPEDILETMHVFFTNPDLAVILKGVSGSSVEGGTIDKALNTLSYLTLPGSGQNFMDMFLQISQEGWSLDSLDKTGQLADSVGRMIDLALVLSQESPQSIAQRVEQMAKQLSSATSYIVAHQSNDTGLAILTAISDILSQNLQDMTNTSSQIQSFLQNIITSISVSGSETDLAPFVQAIDQIGGFFFSLLPPQEAVYFNISKQIMGALAQLVSNPRDMQNLVSSVHEIANAVTDTLTLSNMAILPNGRPVQEILYPLFLSNALATEILFNLSLSDYTFSSNLQRDITLNQAFHQMTSSLPEDVQVYLPPLMSALFSALSNVTSTAQIQPAFFEISQQVTMSLMAALNITEDPLPIGMASGSMVHVLFTVSNEVSRIVYDSLMADPSSNQLPFVLRSLKDIEELLLVVLPKEEQQYLNISLHFMDSVAFALNHTINNRGIMDAMIMFSGSIQSLLAVMPNISKDNSDVSVANLENTMKMLLMALSSGQDPLPQSGDLTQQILLTIMNFLSLSNNSPELDVAKIVLQATEMNVRSLLMTNNTNWADK